MSVFHKLPDSSRGNRHPILIVLDLFGQSDNHVTRASLPYLQATGIKLFLLDIRSCWVQKAEYKTILVIPHVCSVKLYLVKIIRGNFLFSALMQHQAASKEVAYNGRIEFAGSR